FAYTKQVIDLLKKKGIFDNILLLVGGVIPAKDFDKLKEMGVANVYGPGALTSEIINFIRENVKK
ncbi:MAG: methylmalonyl-CoA mutase, partial [Promethearchaeota archaeon]